MPRRSLYGLAAVIIWIVVGVADPAGAQTPFSAQTSFVVSPGDRLVVGVWPDSSLGGVFPVEESGEVHLPLLGLRMAAGKTVDALRRELREGYAEDLQLPVVSLEAQFRVSILGSVRAPGVYWVDPSYRVFELISEAGGFLDNAKEDGVVITRASGESYQIDAARLRVVGSPESTLALRSGDRLVVPKKSGWNWGIFLQSATLIVSIINLANR